MVAKRKRGRADANEAVQFNVGADSPIADRLQAIDDYASTLGLRLAVMPQVGAAVGGTGAGAAQQMQQSPTIGSLIETRLGSLATVVSDVECAIDALALRIDAVLQPTVATAPSVQLADHGGNVAATQGRLAQELQARVADLRAQVERLHDLVDRVEL